MSKLKLKIICLGTIISICSFLLALNTNKVEASSLSLGVDPSIVTIHAIPPTTTENSIKIENKSDTQINLKIQFKPFKAKGEDGSIEYFTKSLDILSNIQVLDADTPIESFTLGPKQQKNLKLRITVPKDIYISDYYFSIIFISTDSINIESNSSINKLGIATNVLLAIGPLEKPKASLEQFSSKIFLNKGPAQFVVRIKNSGDHFIKPKGEILIKNMFGQSVEKLNLLSVNILADSVRGIPNNEYVQQIRDGTFKLKYPVVLWKKDFLLGPYTATLNISMSDEGPAITKTVYFLAFPLQALITIIVIIVIAITFKNRLKTYTNKNRI